MPNSNNVEVTRKAIQTKKEQQSNILAGIIDNESKTYTFERTVSINGVKQKGSFTAKYLGVAARLRIGTIRAKLLEGAPTDSVDTLTDDIAYMIAYLTVGLTKFPSWWSYDALDDIADLRAMYMEVYNFNQMFRQQNDQQTNAGDSSAATGTEVVADK